MVGSPLPSRLRRGYALGSIATGSFGTVPGLLLLPYLTDRLGIGAVTAGFMVFLPKAWDVILNPIAGRISDRTRHPQGHRRPFLLRGGIALAVCFVLLFAGPTTPTALAAAWVVVLFIACATAYSFFQVPFIAYAAELTDDYDERTRLMSWRVALLALAILVSGGLSPEIRTAFGPTWGYRAVGIFVSALILVGSVGAWWATRAAPTTEVSAAGGSLRDQLAVVRRDRNFVALFGAFLLQALATAAMLAGVDYVSRVVLDRPSASTWLFVAFVAPALLVTPLWQRYAVRVGKRAAFTRASVVLGVSALVGLVVLRGPWWLLILCVAVVGIGYAGCQMLPLAMLPDVAAADAARSGENRIGVYTGVWTAGETFALALGPFLYSLFLAAGGYVTSTTGHALQSERTKVALALGFTVLPAVLVVASVLVLRHYRGDRLTNREDPS